MPTQEKNFSDVESISDQLWVPYPSSSDGIPYKKEETLLALCELSKLLRRVLHHNKAEDMTDGSPDDISIKAEIYQELLDLKSRYPLICADMTDSAAYTFTLVLAYNLHWELVFELRSNYCTGITTTSPPSRPFVLCKCYQS